MTGLFSFKNPRFRLIIIAAVAALALVSASYTAYAFLSANATVQTSCKSVETPAFVGRALIKAEHTAERHGLQLEVDQWVASRVYPKNFVVTQRPLPGQPIEKGAKVVIKVSGGKAYPGPKDTDEAVIVSDDVKPLPSPPIRPEGNLEGKVVVIDAGHQRRANLDREPVGPGATQTKAKVQGGTSGIDSRTPEYKVTLAIAQKLKAALEGYGVKVVMTRETHDVDMSNSQRAAVANRNNADLFVRIHADGALDPQKHGTATLYPADNAWTTSFHKQSMYAAQLVQRNLIKTTLAKDNGIAARDDISGFNWSKVPVVLVETGFMTNPQEDRLLNDPSYQDLLAKGIANGVAEFLKTAD